MSEEWVVRVEGKEYGPVDVPTLIEWKREGHLLATNQARREEDETWTIAESIPGVFPPKPPPAAEPSLFQRRSFAQIIGDSLRIYRRGFPTFLFLTLLIALPSAALQFIPAAVDINGQPQTDFIQNASLTLTAIVALVVCWPLFLAGIQIATADLAKGEVIRLSDVLRRAVNYWPRFARLCLVVYGSYFFWGAIPIVVITSMVAAQPSLISIFLALLVLAIQVFMVSRLWVNFLFWQQSATIGGHDVLDALRESRSLARSKTRKARLDRPIWRGAILASFWFLVVIALSAIVELPFAVQQMQSAITTGDLDALIKSVSAARVPTTLTIILSIVSAMIHTLLRPLLGIAFVLLYFDAKTDH